METIIALCDYKNRFGSKDNEIPYRSGMNKELLIKCFNNHEYACQFMQFSDAQQDIKGLAGKVVLYTSQEDIEYKYKDYIEDIIQSIHLCGGIVVPEYKFLRANNNKVFMELLRKCTLSDKYQLQTSVFGCYEEANRSIKAKDASHVIKAAKGAGGHGVFLSKDEATFQKHTKKVSTTFNLVSDVKDALRAYKHSGYTKESTHRERFIVQEFIPSLVNDWKVYVFGEKIYIFFRPILKERVFKASGGGHHNYSYGLNAKIPEGLLDYASILSNELSVPHASFDIAWDGSKFFLLEYQCLYFGTGGITRSQHYFKKEQNKWQAIPNNETIEEVYVSSIVWYLKKYLSRV